MRRTDAELIEARLADHGLIDCARDVVRFVHGTTRDAGWELGTEVHPEYGQGEYGAGFYAFLAVGPNAALGIEKAGKNALRRARQRDSEPCIVHLEMPTAVFANLDSIRVTRENAVIYSRSRGDERFRVVDIPLLWGLVFHNGHEVLWEQPEQYRFWGEAARLLRVVSVRQL